jgi:hypothetical protein
MHPMPFAMPPVRAAFRFALFASLSLVACRDEKKNEAPPPPPPAADTPKPGACTGGGGEVKDPQASAFFPRTEGSYCVDPQGETKVYGAKERFSMDEVCTTAFDGECEVYKRHGLKRVTAFRYVDGGGGAGSVEVYLSQFDTTAGGYGMFTKRVVADGDPAGEGAPRVLAAGGGGAIGTGRAYVWKGPYLVELQYNNEQESPEQLATSSEAILTALGKSIGEKIPGGTDKPTAAALLPEASRIAGGVQYVLKSPLGLPNVGEAAVGYYKDGDTRYRVVSLVRDDADRAKDEFKAIRGKGALPVAGLGDEAAQIAIATDPAAGGAKLDYIFARRGNVVLGIGDEELGDADKAPKLSKEAKVGKLKAWLAEASDVGGDGARPGAKPDAAEKGALPKGTKRP